VLITLAIIGVVAALTIPTVIANYQKKQLYTQFMKEYNAITNAFNMAQVKHGELNSWTYDSAEMTDAEFFKKYMGDSLRISKICTQASDCNIASGATMKTLNANEGSEMAYSDAFNDGSGGFILLEDGAFVNVRIGGSSNLQGTEPVQFMIDINGAKGPNTFGRDLFCFTIYKTAKGYILAAVYTYTCGEKVCNIVDNEGITQLLEECKTTNSDSYGMGCAAKLLLEGKMDY